MHPATVEFPDASPSGDSPYPDLGCLQLWSSLETSKNSAYKNQAVRPELCTVSYCINYPSLCFQEIRVKFSVETLLNLALVSPKFGRDPTILKIRNFGFFAPCDRSLQPYEIVFVALREFLKDQAETFRVPSTFPRLNGNN